MSSQRPTPDAAIAPRVRKAPRSAHPAAPAEAVAQSRTVNTETDREPVRMLSVRIQVGLHRGVKMRATSLDLSMQEATVRALTEWYERNDPDS